MPPIFRARCGPELQGIKETYGDEAEATLAKVRELCNDTVGDELIKVFIARIAFLTFTSRAPVSRASEDAFINHEDMGGAPADGSPYFDSRQLKALDEKLERRRNLYTYCGDVFRLRYLFLTVPALVFTTSATVLGAAWPDDTDAQMSFYGKMTNTTLSGLATLSISLVSLLKYESTHGKTAADSFEHYRHQLCNSYAMAPARLSASRFLPSGQTMRPAAHRGRVPAQVCAPPNVH